MKSMSLTRFELYKILSRKSLWIFLGLMLLCFYLPLQIVQSRNATPYYQATPPTLQQVQAAKADLKKIAPLTEGTPSSPIQPALAESLNQRYLRDNAIITSAKGGAKAGVLQSIQFSLQRMQTQGQTSTFAYRATQMKYKMWKAMPFIGGGEYNGGGAIMMDFIKTFGFVFFGAMLLIGLAPLFSEEYSIGTDSFLQTAKHGKRTLVTAKLMAAGLYVLVIEGILQVFNAASTLPFYGIQGLNYPIQSIPLYYAPFHLVIWQYMIVAVIIQLIGGWAFAAAMALISSLSRSSLISFFVSAGVFLVPELLHMLLQKNWVETVMNFSYTGLTQVSRLFNTFLAYNLFGHPVLYPALVIPLAILVSIPIARLVYTAYYRHQVA